MKTANGVMEKARSQTKTVRRRAASHLEEAESFYNQLQKKAIKGASVADETIHDHPWITVALAAGFGFWMGCCVKSLMKNRTNSWTY